MNIESMSINHPLFPLADVQMSTVVDPSVVASPRDVEATCPEPQLLAFLPNRLPTYKTEDDTHMFSLFHETPNAQQGWRVMLRGLHLPKLLVDQNTVTFLESVKGGVDWKPLPPDNNNGSSGIIFDANTIKSEDDLAGLFGRLNLSKPPEPAGNDGLEIKVEDNEEDTKAETQQKEDKE